MKEEAEVRSRNSNGHEIAMEAAAEEEVEEVEEAANKAWKFLWEVARIGKQNEQIIKQRPETGQNNTGKTDN